MYLTTAEAARYLGLSARTLKRYPGHGRGAGVPPLRRRVRYRRGDLDAWAAEEGGRR